MSIRGVIGLIVVLWKQPMSALVVAVVAAVEHLAAPPLRLRLRLRLRRGRAAPAPYGPQSDDSRAITSLATRVASIAAGRTTRARGTPTARCGGRSRLSEGHSVKPNLESIHGVQDCVLSCFEAIQEGWV